MRELHRAALAAPVPVNMRPPREGGRPSAILVLFGEGTHGPDLLLIQRATGLRRHAGQPAFPGGAIDATDSGPVAAALREATEETGLDPSGVQVLGTLPQLYVAHSGFRVNPVLAWWRSPSAVWPADAGEVAAVARVPVAELVDPANRLRIRVRQAGIGHLSPAFRAQSMLIWGFTAGVLDRLLALGGWERPWLADAPVEDLTPLN
nr:CoA pyrophosphatase [Allonocardiopsis opalescens]